MKSADRAIFISYRREDSATYAGRIRDALANHFGERNVVIDIEILPGWDFTERVRLELDRCRAIVVVIGPRWASSAGGSHEARIEDPSDFVRVELETALRRPNIAAFLVLVDGARAPTDSELPKSLCSLAHCDVIDLYDRDWPDGIRDLVHALEGP